MRFEELKVANQLALDARPWHQPDWVPRPVTGHDPELHRLKHEYPYFGYVEISVAGVRPFVMLSNNDDVVAQVYFWFGADAYEPLSMRVWRRMVREAETVVDIGAYTGLFTLVAAFANPDATLHAIEPSPDVFTRLVMNMAVNRLGMRANLHELAVADKAGEAPLHGYQGMLSLSTGSSLGLKEGKKVEWSRGVRTVRLEDLIGGVGNGLAIKVDAEEAEHRVLEGVGSLRDDDPRLLVEVADDSTLRACLASLPGYTWAVLDDEACTYAIEDPSVLELRAAINEGRAESDERILPPNVVFSRGGVASLANWLSPLAEESSS